MDYKKIMVIAAAIGAVNWGLVTFVNGFNLVTFLTGFTGSIAGTLNQVIYGAVAISGAIVLYKEFKK